MLSVIQENGCVAKNGRNIGRTQHIFIKVPNIFMMRRLSNLNFHCVVLLINNYRTLAFAPLSPLVIGSYRIPANAITDMKISFDQKRSESIELQGTESAFEVIDNLYREFPYSAAFVTCSVKASAADLVAQVRTARKEANNFVIAKGSDMAQDIGSQRPQIEVTRNIGFIVYGGFYQGMLQYYLYCHLFPLWFGHERNLASVLTQVTFDTLIIAPFLCVPSCYIIKGMIEGNTLKDGFEKYVYDLKNTDLILNYCKIWVPASLLSFGVVPEHLRIPFIAFVSFFWLSKSIF